MKQRIDPGDEAVTIKAAKELMVDGAYLRDVRQVIQQWLAAHKVAVVEARGWRVGDMTTHKLGAPTEGLAAAIGEALILAEQHIADEHRNTNGDGHA